MNTNEHSIDNLLSAFFKAEMPKQWPTLKLPTPDVRADMPVPASLTLPTPLPAERTGNPSKSRMALAVSAALILGGFWALSDRFDHQPTHKQAISLDGGTGDISKIGNRGKDKPAPNKTENTPTLP